MILSVSWDISLSGKNVGVKAKNIGSNPIIFQYFKHKGELYEERKQTKIKFYWW